MDYARLELLKLLAEHESIRVRVAEDYRDGEAIANADFLVTYTCDVIPDASQKEVLEAFLSSGGRWFALHGTNSVLEYVKGRGGTPPAAIRDSWKCSAASSSRIRRSSHIASR